MQLFLWHLKPLEHRCWSQDLLRVSNLVFPSSIKVANITLDTSAFPELQRAAKLSSAAYIGCAGKAFDVTITKKINNILTDTQVDMRIVVSGLNAD